MATSGLGQELPELAHEPQGILPVRLEGWPGEEGVVEVRVEPLSAGEEPDELSVSRTRAFTMST